ncbi:hypothetical protein [Nitrosomonas marina]|uniref:Uncharacterized protein n=1 Tax=Nitrosomonas marina TaxID=917 RepID=A0A1H8FNC9_9PROT|nr:hypothetical protein [Nitrosomonas marina]SEN33203.1 hypothetical protein SAMN05216325_1146 [Nitrosomonas marina]
MWSNNQSVIQTYTTFHTENAWANISGLGWRKIRTGNQDGITNTFALLCAAKANGRSVNVYIVDNLIERVYLN